MAGEFGTTHRKVVNDTNAGNIESPTEKAVQTGLGVRSSKTTRIGSSSKTGLAKALLSVAEPVLRNKAEEEQTKKFNEGYERGAKEGMDEIQASESVIGKFLFGKSSTVRGAQQRILHDTAEARMSERLYSMEEDKAKYDRDEYMQVLKEDLDAELENHTDPEIRTQLIDQFSRNSTTLARMHTKQRQIWTDQTNVKAYLDGVANGSRVLRETLRAQDEKGVIEKETDLLKAWEKPEGMSDDAWEKHTVTSVINELSRNNKEALDVFKKSGLYDKIQGIEKQRLDDNIANFDRANTAAFATEYQKFSDTMNEAPEAAVELAQALEARYPNSMNMNKVRAHAVEQRRHLDQLARERQERIQSVRDRDMKAFKEQSVEQQRESVSVVINEQARMAVMAERDKAVDIARANGEVVDYDNRAVTDDEVNDWLLKNPQAYENLWASMQTVVPELSSLAVRTLESSRALAISAEDAEEIRENIAQMDILRDRDEQLFYNHMSPSQAAEYAALSTMFKSTNAHPTEAIETFKQLMKDGRAGNTTAPEQHEVADATNDIYDQFVDMKGEKWLWVFDKTPQNEEILRSNISDDYQRFYQMTGNADMAKAMTRANVMKNGSVIDNTFQPNAQQIKDVSYNNDYEGYLKGIQSNSETNEILNRANWPSDRELTGPGVSHELLPGNQYVRLTTTGTDGLIKVVTLPVPTSEHDMLDYGVKKVTGQFLNEVAIPTSKAVTKGAERVKKEVENVQLLQDF